MKINKKKLTATYNSKSKLQNSIADHFIQVIEAECGKLTSSGKKLWASTCKMKAKEVMDAYQDEIINMIAKKADKVKFAELFKLKNAQSKPPVKQNKSAMNSNNQATESSAKNSHGGNNSDHQG